MQIRNTFKNVIFIACKWCKMLKYYINIMVISCSTFQMEEKECTWVKYLIYSVLWRFQICRNLCIFFLPNLYSQNFKVNTKNPIYGRHQLSWPMRIVGPIQFWRGCVIYLYKKHKNKNKRGPSWWKYFFPSLIKACIPFLSTKQPPQLFQAVKPSTDLESMREATATYFGFYLVLVTRTRKKPARSSVCLQTAPLLYSLQYARFQLKWPTGYSWKFSLHGDLGVQFQSSTKCPFHDLPIH